MELLHKLEVKVLGWLKSAPHLPPSAQKWLGDNVWWIVLVGVILGGLATVIAFFGIFTLIALIGAPSNTYFLPGIGVTPFDVVAAAVGVAFSALTVVISALAIKPLQEKQKKGWVLLFITWILYVLYSFVSAVLTLNVGAFIVGIIFGALFAAIGAYFLFEIHGQFNHDAKKARVVAKK